MFLSKTFVALTLTFRLLIHFDWFLYLVRERGPIPLLCACHFYQHQLLKKTPFYHCIVLEPFFFCKSVVWGCISDLAIPSICMSPLILEPHRLDDCSFVVNSEMGKNESSRLFGLFWVHYIFLRSLESTCQFL
jgi:hypothetical protein